MDGEKICRNLFNKESRMNSKPTCVICGKKAVHKITPGYEEGFMYSCDDEFCKHSIKIQLQGAIKNQN